MITYEKEALNNGYKIIAGMDEAGRGPLAGSVFSAMVIMPLEEDKIIDGINDSKKLTPKEREDLYNKIVNTAIAYSICEVSQEEIDNINILQATKKCMQTCYEEIKIKPDICLVDYVSNLTLPCDFETIVKGDAKSYSIACASILAKVARDNYMLEMDKLYPQYEFKNHKGYGTKKHYEMINKFGICKLHRKSFLKNLKEKHGNIQIG